MDIFSQKHVNYYKIRRNHIGVKEGPMRVIVSIFVLVSALTVAGGAWAADGEEVFTRLKCGMCHKPDKKAAAVSLKQIVQTYSDKDKLVKFFKGEAKPLIESDKWGMMRGQLEKIKALPEADKEALADYLLRFK
jgi:cytochrome c